MAKIYEKGLSNVVIGKIIQNEDGTLTYDNSNKINIAGAMEFSADLSSETTRIAADNDVAYITIQGAYQGTGTIKFTGLTEDQTAYITSAVKSTNGVLGFGEDMAPKELGLKFTKIQVVDGVTYSTDYMFHRVTCGYPSISGSTVSESGDAIADCTISLNIMPLPYKAENQDKTRTYSKVSSKTSASKYATLKDKLFTPTEADAEV